MSQKTQFKIDKIPNNILICFLVFICPMNMDASISARADSFIPTDPDVTVNSPGGIDLRSGSYDYKHTDLSIGNSKFGGIELVRDSTQFSNNFSQASDITKLNSTIFLSNHNWMIRAAQQTFPRPSAHPGLFPTETDISVRIGSEVIIYLVDPAFPFVAVSDPNNFTLGSVLEQTGTIGAPLKSTGKYSTISKVQFGASDYYFIARCSGGETITFNPSSQQSSISPGLASNMREANGINFDLTYDLYSDGSPTGKTPKLKSVVSNTGFALLFNYDLSGLLIQSCMINLSKALIPSNGSCNLIKNISKYAYISNGWNYLSSVTDPAGNIWKYYTSKTDAVNTGVMTNKFYNPGQNDPYLTNTYGISGTVSQQIMPLVTDQVFSDGRHFNYSWTTIPGNMTAYPDFTPPDDPFISTGYSENAASTVVHFYTQGSDDMSVPLVSIGPDSITDANGRTENYRYCLPTSTYACGQHSFLTSITKPNGELVRYDRDYYRNVIKTTAVPFSQPSVQPLVVKAQYDCTNINLCDKPMFVVDANGAQTDYTYDPNHGGVLTVTEPAVNGVRPQTRFTYAQRFAWILAAAGGYVKTQKPVWLIVSKSVCKIGSALGPGCAVAGDEVITTYDYGPDSGPNNLFLRGEVVDANGLAFRSCYSYDDDGNRISETSPRAGLGTCP